MKREREREREPNLVAELEALLRTVMEADAFQSMIVEMLDRLHVGADAAERRDREHLAVMVDAMSTVVAKLVTDARRAVEIAFASRRQGGG